MNSVQFKDGKSPAWWQKAMKDLADVLPDGQQPTVPGKTSTVKASAIALVTAEFFTKPARTRTIALAHQTS